MFSGILQAFSLIFAFVISVTDYRNQTAEINRPISHSSWKMALGDDQFVILMIWRRQQLSKEKPMSYSHVQKGLLLVVRDFNADNDGACTASNVKISDTTSGTLSLL
jgi:hypothetical protein